MSFCLGLPSWSPEIPEIGTPMIFYAHNFLWKTFDWSEVSKKIVALVKSFPTVCGTPPESKYIEEILNF
jgi:hypothetical protein